MKFFLVKSSLTLLLSFLFASNANANWVDLNTGIVEDLTGVVFRGNTGVVSGRGLYYTTNGGNGPSSWTRFEIVGNNLDSLIYEGTKFLHCFSHQNDLNNVFACGVDTVQNKAVVFQLSLSNFSHTLLYVGAANTQLNNIGYSALSSDYFSVGADGLIVQFDAGQAGIEHNTVLTQDLSSISFFNGEFWIGTDGYEIFGTDNNPGITIVTNAPAVNWNIVDVLKTSNTESVGTGNFNFQRSGNNTLALTNYDYNQFSPLDAHCIYKTNNVYFIGTPDGIFRTVLPIAPSSSNPFEIQLTSVQKDIQEFWATPTMSAGFYACGKGGVLLKSDVLSLGGDTKPYVRISQGGSGGCKDAYTYFTGHKGSSTGCQWFIDGNYIGTGCNGINRYFDSVGVYNIMLVGLSPSGTDTAYFSQTITSIPEINKSAWLFDSILCKSEPLQIFIDSSEIDVNYGFYSKTNNAFFGNSGNGNGGTINFNTSNISEEGYYYFVAENSVNSNCFDTFTDSIFVEVEKTHADLHASHINCEIGEDVHFFENCIDADNYEWTFSPGASVSTSSLAEQVNTFNAVSLPQPVELICWSNNGCYDSVVKDGPRVLDLPLSIDSTWVNANESPIQTYAPSIIDIIPVSDGYVIAGRFSQETFGSRFGDSATMNGVGGYLMKYDFRGVLKWKVYSDRIIKSAAVDSDGNIFLTAEFAGHFVDNKNDTTFVPESMQGLTIGALIKLDSLGGMIWNITSNFFFPEKVSIDYSGNAVVSSFLGGIVGWEVPLYHNGIVTSDSLTVKGSGTHKLCVVKFDQSGGLLWDVMMTMSNVNIGQITKITFDSINNVYINGVYEGGLETFPTDLTDSIVTPFYGASTGGVTFLTKLDSLGQFGWQTRCYTDDALNSAGTHSYDMVTDADGNSYITGKNRYYQAFNGLQIFENVNGTVTTSGKGQFFVLKVNTAGICEWIKTGDFSSYGIGNRLFLDGNDRLFVLGWVGVVGTTNWSPVKFQNDDGTMFSLTERTPNYFIAEYDTTGYIHSMFLNNDGGYSSTQGIYSNYYPISNFPGVFKHVDSSFYLARNIQLSGGATYNEFGTPMTTVGRDTWVVKFKRENGIEIPMTYYSEIDTIVCSGTPYQMPNGSSVLVTSNVLDTTILIAQNGSDSIIVTNIGVVQTFNTTQNFPVCSGSTVVYPDGTSELITVATTHTSILTSSLGCDSIITTNVLINSGPTVNVFDTTCVGTVYLFGDGTSQIINGPTTYSYTTVTAIGCDSLTNVNLQTYPLISAAVLLNNGTLIANPIFQDAYQWFFCENQYQIIPGATGPTYVADSAGFYAVIVTSGNCSDTSDCEYFDLASINEESSLNSINIYPNPTAGVVTVEFIGFESLDLVLTDIFNRSIKTWNQVKSGDKLLLEELESGVYLIRADKHEIRLRLVKQ